ncbi:MAG: MotA/TolQ/ExbB proton channel family protein [Leptospiraceae bacterium]|nr:MotA/TolQ/ExbB proton channel family protein [Leptospiraceae bacterium]MCB1201205.1 MotA/TolQ/ExbB proton channel family protein [Leptospiraceae bacterium]
MSSLVAGIPGWFVTSIIIFVSILGLTIILERGYTLMRRYKLLETDEQNQLLGFLQNRKYEDALSFCRLRNHPAFRVTENIILAKGSEVDLRNIADEAILRQVTLLEKFLPTLGTISTVAPLLGLLGTVTGMIKSFRAFEQTASRSSNLMTGIDEALITTALGLIVAIPAMITYNYYIRRVNALTDETNLITEMVLDEIGKK